MMVTLTIVRYKPYTAPFALLAMAVHRLPLMLNKGCTFWKLMGTGKNGTFDLKPDWAQWGLLAVWDDDSAMQQFFQSSFIEKWWGWFGKEVFTIYCKPLQSHGYWDGKQPFNVTGNVVNDDEPIAVLTRASVRFNRLKNFWRHVDGVARLMSKAPGYITSVGVGEAPFYRQATFSIWQSAALMKEFAYKSAEHAEVIKKTRNEGWYSEELFARFKIIKYEGTINGIDPLKDIII